MTAVDMYEVRRAHRGYWFKPSTLRFFRSRVGNTAYESNDGRYRFFVSSEQFDYTSPRLYTVRVQDTTTGGIDTVGTFQGYESRRRADNDAQGYALDPSDACSLITGDGGSCPIHDGWHDKRDPMIAARLEELRAILRSESISYGELAELADLAEHIDPSDVELLEPAGVPEHEEERAAFFAERRALRAEAAAPS